MTQRQDLAKQFLLSILESVKSREKIEGFAYTWLEEIIEISYLNGFDDLMADGLRLRTNSKKLGNRLAGLIHNFEISAVNTAYEWPKDKIELEKKYSYQNVTDFLKLVQSSTSSSMSAICVSSPEQVDAALKLAKDDSDMEVIACSLCVHGYFEAAQKMITNELSQFPYRVGVVKMVMCIELFRKDEFDQAKTILDQVYLEDNSNWTNLQLARGILGYQPWGGYPFSDH